MTVIGNKPATNFQSIRKQTITGTGATAYSLDHPVSSPNDIEVFVNNIRQEPVTAYNATSQTITFSEAITSADSAYMIYQAQTMGTIAHPADQDLSATNITASGTLDVTGATTLSGGITGDLAVDTNTLKVDATNNRVGIGTTAPERDLHIKGATSDPVHLKLEGDPADYARIMFDNGTTDNIGEVRYDFSDNAIKFNTNGAYRAQINSSGYLGIGSGISNPNSALHVEGRIRGLENASTHGGSASSTQYPIANYAMIGGKSLLPIQVSFPNTYSNLAIRLYAPQTSLWISGEAYIGATYSHGNASGFRTYTFTHNYNSGTNYNTTLTNTENRGSTNSHFEFNSHGWDSTEGAHYFEFRHIASSGNTLYLQFETFGSGVAYAPSWYYRHTTY